MNDDTFNVGPLLFACMVYIGNRILWSNITVEVKLLIVAALILAFTGGVLHDYLLEQLEEAQLRRRGNEG